MDSQDRAGLRVIDSHTAGEPTRVVIEGVPPIGTGDMHSRRESLASHADWVRTSLILEPRGAPWMVGVVLQEPVDPSCAAGVIFFNNTGYIDMCGHGLIGVVKTLAYLDRIEPGSHRLKPCRRDHCRTERGWLSILRECCQLSPGKRRFNRRTGIGKVTGDIAYGGNWFFLTAVEHLDPAMIVEYSQRTKTILHELRNQSVPGSQDETMHVELIGPPSDPSKANARSFVLCPGGHYDRSPCGTGTSAKVACLAADDRLAPGETWRQESILGGVFEASYRHTDAGIIPTISGRAFITGETTVVLDPEDSLQYGIGSDTTVSSRAGGGKTEDA